MATDRRYRSALFSDSELPAVPSIAGCAAAVHKEKLARGASD
ncbi:MAG TPA: hypothetical protein VGY53_10490 [Isosphaeraceae bacterium]|nr:hypothetical protein [Isosphaeraceae bacterium]